MARVKEAAARLGIILEPAKEVGPTTTITFLGIELDSLLLIARLPQDKFYDLRTSIPQWLTRRKCTQRELQSVIGKMSFACKVVPAGRIFLRRLIDLAYSAIRPHHHINITQESKKDFRWWLDFLPSWNGVTMMLEAQLTSAADMEIYTNSSGTHGFGAYYRGNWLRGAWQHFQTLQSGKPIAWQELFS